MTRSLSAVIAAASLIALSSSAFAQPASPMAGGMKSGDMPNTCQGRMDKASPMMDSMADGAKKTMAMKEMDMAKTSMSAGNEKTCMTHMKKVMGMM